MVNRLRMRLVILGLVGISLVNLACFNIQDRRSWSSRSGGIALIPGHRLMESETPESESADSQVETKESGPESDTIASRLLELHNQRRAEEKLSPLSSSEKLNQAAHLHAKDMAKMGKMTHQGSDGSNLLDRVRRLSYAFQKIGENIAFGQETPEDVVQSWMESSKHRENILGQFQEMGAAQVVDDEGRTYWCVTFGTPLPKLDPDKAIAELLQLINQRRLKENLPEFQTLDPLTEVAQDHVRFMAQTGGLRQEGPDGQTPFERLHSMDFKYRRIALNVSSGQPKPKAMLDTLLNDPEQRRNVLGRFNRIGMSYAVADDGTPYWVILFAEVPSEIDSN